MTLFSIILVLVMLAFIGMGLKDGFIITLGRIAGAVIGFLAAKAWYVQLSFLLSWLLPTNWAQIVTFFLIFSIITRLLGWVFSMLDKTYHFIGKMPFMQSANHVLGAVLGFLEGIVIIGGLIWVNLTFNLIPFFNIYTNGSMVAKAIYKAFLWLLWFLLK